MDGSYTKIELEKIVKTQHHQWKALLDGRVQIVGKMYFPQNFPIDTDKARFSLQEY